jgi:hypothetical protein
MMSLTSACYRIIPLNEAPPSVDAMPLSPEQEVLCGRAEPLAAALIRQQAKEIDDLWDRLSHAYALVRRESPSSRHRGQPPPAERVAAKKIRDGHASRGALDII